MEIDTQAKSVTCDKCGKTFNRHDLYVRHQKRHEKGLWFRRTGNYAGQPNGTLSSTSDGENAPNAGISPSMEIITNTSVGPENSISPLSGNTPLSGGFAETFQVPSILQPVESTPDVLQNSAVDAILEESDFSWLFERVVDLNVFPPIENNIVSPESVSDHGGHTGSSTSQFGDDSTTLWTRARDNVARFVMGEANDKDLLLQGPNIFSLNLLNSWIYEPTLLESYFHKYFEFYHDHFPIAHFPTFRARPDKIHPALLIAITTLGTAFGPPEHFEASVQLHEGLIFLVMSHQDMFSPPLWIFQTLCLILAFQKMLSTRDQHERSALFHGAIMVLIRRNFFRIKIADMEGLENDNDSQLEKRWHRWVETESRIRCFYFAFVMDSQHMALFGHRSCMSANELVFSLPCLEKIWEANDPSTWRQEYLNSAPSMTFLDALKSLLVGRHLNAPATSHFARLVLLHGIFSVTLQMQIHEAITLGVANSKNCERCETNRGSSQDQWRVLMGRAINNWSYCLYTQRSMAIEVCRALRHIAYVTLFLSPCNVSDVLMYAGLSTYDRTSNYIENFRSQRAVSAWASSSSAPSCVKHALLLIQDVLFSSQEPYRALNDKIALRPWCLFLCTAIVYAYHLSLHGENPDLPCDDTGGQMTEQYITSRIHALNSAHPDTEFINADLDYKRTGGIKSLFYTVKESLRECKWELLQNAFDCI